VVWRKAAKHKPKSGVAASLAVLLDAVDKLLLLCSDVLSVLDVSFDFAACMAKSFCLVCRLPGCLAAAAHRSRQQLASWRATGVVQVCAMQPLHIQLTWYPVRCVPVGSMHSALQPRDQ
jgi:hypothetical protein